jgi:phenylacetic acid degradation operon negative regulatory protein
VLAESPPGCRVHRATLGLPATDAAEIARAAWDLDSLQDTYREHIATLSAVLGAEAAPATAATLRQLAELLNAPYVDLIRDPGLPVELLPANWPGRELTHIMSRVRDRLAAPARAYVHGVIASATKKEAVAHATKCA